MPTNLAIDDKLLDQVKHVGGFRTKREAVNEAMREYLRYRRQLEVIQHFGTIDFDPKWDYKKARRMR
jgi:Arc/MetJ family transcription regulator